MIENLCFKKIIHENTLVEISGRAFEIGKVMLCFRKFDPEKAAGERASVSIDMYLGISEFARFCHLMLTGNIYKWMNNPSTRQALTKFAGKKTDDGVLSKILTFEKGNKLPLVLKVQEQTGIVDTKGLIKPAKNPVFRRYVTIGLSHEETLEFALMGNKAIDYYFANYVEKGFEKGVKNENV